jgi:carbamoyl-phosphate synthase large subunit
VSGRSVLLTCAGQRVDIAGAFRAALDELGGAGRVVCVDAHPLSPTLFTADAGRVVPPIRSEGYIPALLELVEEHSVGAVLPLTDLDNAELAGARDAFAAAGATLFLPDEAVVSRLFDKYQAHRLLGERGIGSPDTWLPEDLPESPRLPMLVKQRWGYASRNIFRCDSMEELRFFLGYAKEPVMAQQLCEGEEFSIDVLCDLEGRALNVIPRTMIESKGGESIKGMTISDERLVEYGRFVAERLELRGPATIQCFEEDEQLLVTDVNTRFGGAFPLPLAAGSRYPELILRLAAGERVEPHVGRFRAGVVMTRYFDALTLEEPPQGSRALSLRGASMPA